MMIKIIFFTSVNTSAGTPLAINIVHNRFNKSEIIQNLIIKKHKRSLQLLSVRGLSVIYRNTFLKSIA